MFHHFLELIISDPSVYFGNMFKNYLFVLETNVKTCEQLVNPKNNIFIRDFHSYYYSPTVNTEISRLSLSRIYYCNV